jgi:hypothetical protein
MAWFSRHDLFVTELQRRVDAMSWPCGRNWCSETADFALALAAEMGLPARRRTGWIRCSSNDEAEQSPHVWIEPTCHEAAAHLRARLPVLQNFGELMVVCRVKRSNLPCTISRQEVWTSQS